MAKKKTAVQQKVAEIEKVFSMKYKCLLTATDAYWSDEENSWLNKDVEENVKNTNFGK